jgi:hypothetical protein
VVQYTAKAVQLSDEKALGWLGDGSLLEEGILHILQSNWLNSLKEGNSLLEIYRSALFQPALYEPEEALKSLEWDNVNWTFMAGRYRAGRGVVWA